MRRPRPRPSRRGSHGGGGGGRAAPTRAPPPRGGGRGPPKPPAAPGCRVGGQEQQRASEAEARARAALLEAGSLAAEIPVLTNRLRALDAVSGLIKPRDDARRRLELGQAEQDRREAELVGGRAEQGGAV